jgi:hypothetical protein
MGQWRESFITNILDTGIRLECHDLAASPLRKEPLVLTVWHTIRAREFCCCKEKSLASIRDRTTVLQPVVRR